MATTKRRVRRPRKVRPVVKEEEVLEKEILEELEEEEAPKPRRRKKVVEPDPVEEEYDDDDEYEDEAPEPAPKPKPRRRKVKVVEPEPEPEPEPEVAEVTDMDIFYGLLENLDDGAQLTITRTGEETWTVSSGVCAPTAPVIQKLRGAAFWSEVCTPEYQEHEEEWGDMTLAEKKASAKKLKVTWEAHEDARVDNIRMTQAVRAKLGITKYKPDYATRAARAAIRG